MANYLDETINAIKKLKAMGVQPSVGKALAKKNPNVKSITEIHVESSPASRMFEDKPLKNTNYIFFGDRLDNDTKRGLFVVDSIANEHLKNVEFDPEAFSKEVRSFKEMNDLRHKHSNYDEEREKFRNDINRALKSNLIPRNSGIGNYRGRVNGNVMSNDFDGLQWIPKPDERANKTSFLLNEDSLERKSYSDGIDLYETFFRNPLNQRLYKERRKNGARNFINETPASRFYWNYKSSDNPRLKPMYNKLNNWNLYKWNNED